MDTKKTLYQKHWPTNPNEIKLLISSLIDFIVCQILAC